MQLCDVTFFNIFQQCGSVTSSLFIIYVVLGTYKIRDVFLYGVLKLRVTRDFRYRSVLIAKITCTCIHPSRQNFPYVAW